MTNGSERKPGRLSRRSLLAAGTVGVASSLGGCVNQVQSLVTDSDEQVGLEITTLPADDDHQSVQIARKLEAHLDAVGINVTLDIRSRTELLRKVLIDREFDIFVGAVPRYGDPDYLYELLHSTFAEESGWQNPYGFSSLLDNPLEEQRQLDGQRRRDVVADLLVDVARMAPFVPVCAPHSYHATNPGQFEGWEQRHPSTREAYLDLEPVDGDEPEELVSVITDSRPTRNLNPFSTEHRNHGLFVDLLYDSLATESEFDDVETESELTPWLAESWTRNEDELAVTLRAESTFHDGEPVTADDVAFTYEFLSDTSLGVSHTPLPVSNYRRHASSIDSVTVEDDRTVVFSVSAGTVVAQQALTVPILPEHVWGAELDDLDEDDFPSRQARWGLLSTDDEDLIVGSGPFQYADSTDRDELVLERFDDHFTRHSETDLPETPLEEVTFLNTPNDPSAIQHVGSDVAGVTTSRLEAHVVEDLLADGTVEDRRHEPRTFYQIGFNCTQPPFSDYRFRQDVVRLMDREWIVEDVFEGHADPISTPVSGEWVPDRLDWEESGPELPFIGNDGRLDLQRASDELSWGGFRTTEENEFYTNY